MGAYTIKSGDTLSAIAKTYGTTVSALAGTNNIANVNKIYAGNTINIPDEVSNTPTVSTPTPQATNTAVQNINSAFTPSETLKASQNNVSTMGSAKPTAYVPTYQSQIDGLLGKILNREKLNYDYTSDTQYKTLKDKYTNEGKLNMMNAQAQASSNTGGYGSSYSATAGNQAYQSSLSNLNSAIPTLQAQALEGYNNQGTTMNNNLSTMQGLENTNYSKYRDGVSDYNNEYALALQTYNDLYNKEYGTYRDNKSDTQTDRGYNYQVSQAAQSQANYERELALKYKNL